MRVEIIAWHNVDWIHLVDGRASGYLTRIVLNFLRSIKDVGISVVTVNVRHCCLHIFLVSILTISRDVKDASSHYGRSSLWKDPSFFPPNPITLDSGAGLEVTEKKISFDLTGIKLRSSGQ
jgi:hypothetical protein